MQIGGRLALAGGSVLVALAVLGVLVGDDGETPLSGDRATPTLEYVSWTHPTGLFGARVPAGWRVDGALGDAMDQGQFRINAYSPDGRSFFSLGHNWLSFMEFQYGPYRPGHATIEQFVLPRFLQQQGGYSGALVVYRSANRRLTMPTQTGVPIPFDSGTLGFLLRRADGGFSAGTAFGETMYIASPGTPGLWRLRLFAAQVAPAEPRAQANAQAALIRAVETLELSPEFFSLWNRAFDHTMQQMRRYSAQMDRVFSRYLQSAGRSSSGGKDPLEGWAEMMRGGRYATDDETGEQYWVGNDHDYWFKNDAGDVVGNDTGEVPTYGENWRRIWP